ncbi:hypothetical protein [Tessaracoccus sp.]
MPPVTTSWRHTVTTWLPRRRRRRDGPATFTPTINSACTRHPDACATFTGHGWTAAQWDDLCTFYAGHDQAGGQEVAYWLRHPPATFATPITPTMIRDLFDRYEELTFHVLTAIAAGASERFCAGFFNPQWHRRDHVAVVDGWAQATALNLTEPEAVGWAATDYLGCLRDPAVLRGVPSLSRAQLAVLIRTWISFFGPTAYLYVLAGYDLDEAVAMRDAKTSPTPEQLRVMVALAGHTLPAGV